MSGIGFIFLLYVYFSFFLGPLNRSRDAHARGSRINRSKLGSSKNEMTKAANLENQASAATKRYAALTTLSPEGAPIAWFPPRMKIFFANQQIDKTTARLENSVPIQRDRARRLDAIQLDRSICRRPISRAWESGRRTGKHRASSFDQPH